MPSAPRRARTAPQPPAVPAHFAAAAPGLEPLVAAELRALGIRAAAPEAGGVAFGGGDDALMRANLWLRTASRVVVRVAEFHATAFHELERQAERIPWQRFVTPGGAVRFRVTCRKSRLYHSDAVAERFVRAVERRLGMAPRVAEGGGGEDDDEGGEGEEAQLFVVRFVRDVCTVSADSSGTLLHRRGWRQAVARAPLRETLAAATLLGSGWTPEDPLLDPLCGSGTIAIEAALISRDMAPGLGRSFAFERWPGHDAGRWAEEVARARSAIRPAARAPIMAADRDAGAVAAAVANAERAGVAADVVVERRPLSAIPAGIAPRGWVVTNPPYGVRVGERAPLRDLYASLGMLVGERLPGWSLALLAADRALEGQVGLELHERWRSTNGGIPVRLLVSPAEPVEEEPS